MSSLATGLRILARLDAPSARLSVTDTAAALGLPKSTVSRAMRDLAEAGMLERAPGERGYGAGPALFRLGGLYKAARLPVDELDRGLAALTARFPATGYIAVLRGADTVILRVREGTHPVRVGQREGAVLPAWITAIGKSLLARLDPAEVAETLPERLEWPELRLSGTRAELLEELAECRARGFAELHDRALRGIDAVAVAVRPRGREPVGAALCWMQDGVDAALRAEMVAALLALQRNVAAAVGDQPPSGSPAASQAR
jgi:DNA-binding IclR family transcriptional regulator